VCTWLRHNWSSIKLIANILNIISQPNLKFLTSSTFWEAKASHGNDDPSSLIFTVKVISWGLEKWHHNKNFGIKSNVYLSPWHSIVLLRAEFNRLLLYAGVDFTWFQRPPFFNKGNNYNNIKQKKLILLRGRLTDINQYLHTKL